MNYMTPANQLNVGVRKVDTSRGENRGELSAQWATRPDDQRFTSLTELYHSVATRRDSSFEAMLRPLDINLRASKDSESRITIEADGRSVVPTHYSFGQICSLAKAPASYLRSMHALRAAANLSSDLLQRAEDRPIKLYGNTVDNEALAFTGPDYGRIYDAALVESVLKFAGPGSHWKVPGQMNWGDMTYNPYVDVTKETTTLYASDRDVFMFLVDDTHPIEIGKLANGDPDLIFRGFYAFNSEVGARSLGIATFWLRAVCQNRNLWGVEDFSELRIVHSKHGNLRFAREAAPALERYASSSPTKLLAGIKASREAIVAKDKEERIDFLTKKGGLDLSLKAAERVIETHEREEGRAPESIWDMVNGLTAMARTLPHQDSRLELEKTAAKLMNRAARHAV